MIQKEWFSLKDLSLIENSETIVDVLFENGNIVEGIFYSYIEWFAFGRNHFRHHMFANKINNKAANIKDLTIVGWKFKENKNDC